MKNLKSGLVLAEDENLIIELEAELWSTSSNFFAKLLGALKKVWNLIFGCKKIGYIIITDKRVVEISQEKACWVFNTSRNVKCVLPSSVKEVGYLKTGTFAGCCCQAYTLYYDSLTQRTSILLSKINSDHEAQVIVDAFYRALIYTK